MSQPKNLKFVFWLIAFMLLLYLVNFSIGVYLGEDGRGTFGDMFGAVNALFSGLACVGIGYAIVLQHQEISLVRAEAAHAKSLLDAQNSHLLQQRLSENRRSAEGTFYHILALLNGVKSSIVLNSPRFASGGRSGARAFDIIERYMVSKLPDHIRIEVEDSKGVLVQNSDFENFYRDEILRYYEDDLGHYFRLMRIILRFMDGLERDDGVLFAEILKSQLFNGEIRILLFHCGVCDSQLESLCKKYRIFDVDL